ncbi:MAG: TerB family tellurite resistance protein [Pseudomonadota bacterium]|nr:TerB family tellurite resistance protein [Pseudomonadota bacterium]
MASVWGKIIGGVGGLALGGPIGALIGAVAGHMVDKARVPSAQPDDATKSIAFTIATIALGAKMAKADGVVTREEVNAFKQVFRIPAEETANVARVFDRARRDHRGYEPYARQIAGMFADNPGVLEELLYCLTRIARADGVIHPEEENYLRSVAEIFGLDAHVFERITEIAEKANHSDPYRVLGVDTEISNDGLKLAYRALVRENHPDKLIADGMPEELVELANEKLAAINDAYDRVAASRGLN